MLQRTHDAPPCNKECHLTKKDAQTALNHCRKKRRARRPVRIYRCWRCNAWHLTSKKYRPPNQTIK